MIESVIYIILKIVAMMVLLVAMIMVLLGIRHISNPAESATREETDALKREVQSEQNGISRHNLFRQFIFSNRNR